jgi:hypothetical protein
VTYEIPIQVLGTSGGRTVIAQGSIVVDNSERFNPYWLLLFGLLAIPIMGILRYRNLQNKTILAPENFDIRTTKNRNVVRIVNKKHQVGQTRGLLKESETEVVRVKIRGVKRPVKGEIGSTSQRLEPKERTQIKLKRKRIVKKLRKGKESRYTTK